MKKIAASILGKENKSELVNLLIDKGVKYIHYDVMDGEFVSRHSLPIGEILKIINETNVHYKDIHLMVKNPSPYIEALSNKVNQISVHMEVLDDVEKFVKKYYKKIKLGLVVNPETDIKKTFPFLKYLNHVMIMSVKPGKGGQSFIETSIEKIKLLKKEIDSKQFKVLIEIDGGINNIWGPTVFKEGVDLAVSGSYLIDNIDNGSIEKLQGN